MSKTIKPSDALSNEANEQLIIKTKEVDELH
jgi:hypothetical protein